MKILVYAEIHPNLGTGNIVRMYRLYKYLKIKCTKTEVIYASNNLNVTEGILTSLGYQVGKIECDYIKRAQGDIILYDSMLVNSKNIVELKNRNNKIIMFDADYSHDLADYYINLLPVESNEEKIKSGVDYLILDEKFKEIKKPFYYKKGSSLSIIVAFGGEDPSSLTSTTLEKLVEIKKSLVNEIDIRVKVIVGQINKDKKEIFDRFNSDFEILEPSRHFAHLVNESDLVICSAGTTVLEAIYLGKPIILYPQNKHEQHFANYIKSNVETLTLEDLLKLNDEKFLKEIYIQYTQFVDGKGKERIYELIEKELIE